MIIRAGGNTFTACVPLKLLLGFAENYKKILICARQELILRRSRTDVNALQSVTQDDTSSLEISRMIWMVPSLGVSDTARISLLNIIRKDVPITVPFRSWSYFKNPNVLSGGGGGRDFTWTITSMSHLEKPRYIIITFQINRKNRYGESINQYDHVNVADIKVYLNSEVFPHGSMNLESNKYAQAYKMYCDFQQSYYGRGDRTPHVSYERFKNSRTIFVIDCATRDERAKVVSTDIRLEVKMSDDIDNPIQRAIV